MLLVLPFIHADSRLAVQLAKYLSLVGPYKSHEALVASVSNNDEFVDRVREALGDQFDKVHVFQATNVRPGWPGGPNQMFHAIAYYIWTQLPCECWYFFEPDNTPVKPNWLNSLYDEYRRTQRPFLGVIHGSYWLHHQGTPEEQFVQDGTHLVGTSIYPRDAPRYSKLFNSIPYAQVPWDVYWQWEVIKHAAGTNLIQHEWRTMKYRRDEISGDVIGERAPGTKLPYDPRPISPTAVVVHGCKDGSLMAIMRRMFESRTQPVPA